MHHLYGDPPKVLIALHLGGTIDRSESSSAYVFIEPELVDPIV